MGLAVAARGCMAKGLLLTWIRCTTVSCKGLPLARSAEFPPDSQA